uniref:CCHC-type domain-containing protein n=1 Tax=Photinus pyralis TaxID=7054 RepID=A0A1Y1JUV7_PHOPY
MNVNALKSDELTEELRFRNIDATDFNVDQKRKLLRSKLAMEALNPSVLISYAPVEYDVGVELNDCELKVSELEMLVQEFLSNPSPQFYTRIHTRLSHILARINRLRPDEALKVAYDNITSRCLECIDRIGNAHDSLQIQDADNESDQGELQQNSLPRDYQPIAHSSRFIPRVSFSAERPNEEIEPITQVGALANNDNDVNISQRLDHLRRELDRLQFTELPPNRNYANASYVTGSKSVPVYKWGLAFTGDVNELGVNSFLQRVNELRIARHISTEQLFDSAVDLFKGDGLVWFRAIRTRVSTWEELVNKLRYDFLPTNFDDELWEEIKRRKQGQDEKPSIYIASMLNMFDRLVERPSENCQLKYILRNLQPYYATQLSLVDINSLEQLHKCCKRLEETRLQNSRYRNPSAGPSFKLEPDLMYKPALKKTQVNTLGTQSSKKQITINSKPNTAKPTTSCYNCGNKGHTFHTCLEERKVFLLRLRS